jgi:glutamyl-Q tRNA(Asp) synthetase
VEWETPARRQSEHLDVYQGALRALIGRGLVYRCFRTRKEVMDEIGRAPHGSGPAPFRGGPLPAAEEAERLERGDSFAWRLSLEAARRALGPAWEELSFVEEGEGAIRAEPGRAGDVVLARKDLGVAYHLAVVADDALQGITHVIRGEDLKEAAHIQRLLQALLDLPAPVYRHHALLLRPDGKRFAKRDTAETLRELRAGGMSAGELRRRLGFD